MRAAGETAARGNSGTGEQRHGETAARENSGTGEQQGTAARGNNREQWHGGTTGNSGTGEQQGTAARGNSDTGSSGII
ncbi:hypothetical protein ACOMHN_030197 [Nucella lapillus]